MLRESFFFGKDMLRESCYLPNQGRGTYLRWIGHLIWSPEDALDMEHLILSSTDINSMCLNHLMPNALSLDITVLWHKHGDKTLEKVHPARDLDSNSGISRMSTDCIRKVPETKPLRDGDFSIDLEDSSAV